MSFLRRPADVFIGYSRKDKSGYPSLFAELLNSERSHAKFMDGNAVFFDKRLRAGEQWSEELAKHASGCAVFVAVVGQCWLEVVKERRDAEGIPFVEENVQYTDWIRKELQLALDRPDPAKLLIVLTEGVQAKEINAKDLFPIGKVREHFENAEVQMLNYEDTDEKKHEFQQAVEQSLGEYRNSQAVSESHSGNALFERVDTWLRFISRRNIWQALSTGLGVGMPTDPAFESTSYEKNALALMITHNDDQDEPTELVQGFSHHLYVKGQYAMSKPGTEAVSTSESWTQLGYFPWPSVKKIEGVRLQILDSLKVDPGERAGAAHNSEEFVSVLARAFRDSDRSPCLYTCFRIEQAWYSKLVPGIGRTLSKNNPDLKLALEFIEHWNNLQWSELPHPVALNIVVYTPVQFDPPSLVIEPIQKDCVNFWVDNFLQNKLQIRNLSPPPHWWGRVQKLRSEYKSEMKYASIKNELI